MNEQRLSEVSGDERGDCETSWGSSCQKKVSLNCKRLEDAERKVGGLGCKTFTEVWHFKGDRMQLL